MKQVSLVLVLLALPLLAAAGCAAAARPGSDATRDGASPPAIRDLTRAGISAPCAADDVPAPAALRVFVPWDSAAILAVLPEGDARAGALVVRYGKSAVVDAGGAATLYLLEAPGTAVEPIAIEWQPASGAELRAIARVDGALRRYEFAR